MRSPRHDLARSHSDCPAGAGGALAGAAVGSQHRLPHKFALSNNGLPRAPGSRLPPCRVTAIAMRDYLPTRAAKRCATFRLERVGNEPTPAESLCSAPAGAIQCTWRAPWRVIHDTAAHNFYRRAVLLMTCHRTANDRDTDKASSVTCADSKQSAGRSLIVPVEVRDELLGFADHARDDGDGHTPPLSNHTMSTMYPSAARIPTQPQGSKTGWRYGWGQGGIMLLLSATLRSRREACSLPTTK